MTGSGRASRRRSKSCKPRVALAWSISGAAAWCFGAHPSSALPAGQDSEDPLHPRSIASRGR
jgi:hypothetical protein